MMAKRFLQSASIFLCGFMLTTSCAVSGNLVPEAGKKRADGTLNDVTFRAIASTSRKYSTLDSRRLGKRLEDFNNSYKLFESFVDLNKPVVGVAGLKGKKRKKGKYHIDFKFNSDYPDIEPQVVWVALTAIFSLFIIPSWITEEYVMQVEVTENNKVVKKIKFRDNLKTYYFAFSLFSSERESRQKVVGDILRNMVYNAFEEIEKANIIPKTQEAPREETAEALEEKAIPAFGGHRA